MKITPPADETERRLWKRSLERQLHLLDGRDWRVDIIRGRHGWYARAVPVLNRSGRRGSKAAGALQCDYQGP
jgi:hypothetical protein